jgi:HEAT repeat protein
LDGQALTIATLCDDDWRMRVHAVSILGQCVDQAWACKLLRNACESLDDRVRVRAVDALGSCQGSFDEVDVFRAHLSDKNERVRTAAFRALVRLGPLEEEELRQALLDLYPPMQQAALVALLSSDQYLKSQPLWTLAEQITAQSTDPEITVLRTEVIQRLTPC